MGQVEASKMTPLPSQATHEFTFNDYQAEVIKGNQLRSSGWVKSPGYLQMLSVALQRLVKLTDQEGKGKTAVTHVRAARRNGTRKIFLWPVPATDPAGIPVTGAASRCYINLISLLGPEELTVESGYRELYPIEFATEGAPVPHALVMDMSRPLDRRTMTKRVRGGPKPDTDNDTTPI